jgi:hypothetical protein
MKTEEQIRERIIELNYFLVYYMTNGDKKAVEKTRIEINSLLNLYLNKKESVDNDIRSNNK